MSFVSNTFSVDTARRRLKSSCKDSPAMMRGALVRAARRHNLHSYDSHDRALQITSDDPLMELELNEMISISFDFNFGDAQKDLLVGVQFNYDSDDSITNS